MQIEFTKEQFENLMKLVYLGNWMANAIHNDSKEDPIDKDLDQTEDYVYSFAKDFGFEKLVEYNADHKTYYPTSEFEELCEKYIEDFNDDCFWEELFHRIYERDFERKYSQKEISKMDMKELFEKEEPFRQKWDKELMDHGIDRLEIKE